MSLTFDGPKNIRAWLMRHPKGKSVAEDVAKDWLTSAEGMAWMESQVGERQEKATVLVVIDHRNPAMPCVTVYGDRARVRAKVEHELFIDHSQESVETAEAELLSRLKGDYIVAYLDDELAHEFVELVTPWLERERQKESKACKQVNDHRRQMRRKKLAEQRQ